MVMEDWKGYVIAGFSIVWIANAYMSIYAIIRQIIKKEKTEINLLEKEQVNGKSETNIHA